MYAEILVSDWIYGYHWDLFVVHGFNPEVPPTFNALFCH